MKLNLTNKKVASAGAVALLGLAMSGVASAETFNANATVQTTVAITHIVDMELGTIYATTAQGASGGNTCSFIAMAADGTMGTKTDCSTSGFPMIALGGQSPATASIAVSSTTPVTLTLPDAELAAGNTTLAAAAGDAAAAAVTDLVTVAAADPSVAQFQLLNFTAGNVTGGTAGADCSDLTDAAVTCTLTPSFGSTQVDFGIGATILTDVSSGNTAYQPTTYTGTFTATASY